MHRGIKQILVACLRRAIVSLLSRWCRMQLRVVTLQLLRRRPSFKLRSTDTSP